MNLKWVVRRPELRTSLMLSAVFLTGSALMLWMDSNAVREMREVGLPAAVRLPQIEKRMDILKEQNDIADLQASLRGGSNEEMLHVYVLPDNDDAVRLLAMFDVIFGYLQQSHDMFSVSPVKLGDHVPAGENLEAIPVTFDATFSQEGLRLMLLFTRLSGLLTVSDALTPDDIKNALALTEQENPASVAALEHFLSIDLLRYSEEPQPYENELRKSFSDASEPGIRAMLDTPHLRDARELFSKLAPVLRRQNLWPLRLLTVEHLSSGDPSLDRVTVHLMLNAYVRTE